uniref:Secreted protein n=1 Tax=Panagrellus redivivus TaxID=6233 RepID=A0A7E4URV9_PANRE
MAIFVASANFLHQFWQFHYSTKTIHKNEKDKAKTPTLEVDLAKISESPIVQNATKFNQNPCIHGQKLTDKPCSRRDRLSRRRGNQ